MKIKTSIPVIYKKLGKHKAWGRGTLPIQLDERLKGKKHLEILTHECLHHLFPELTEDQIINKSIILTNTIWKEDYRRVDSDNSIPLQDGSI